MGGSGLRRILALTGSRGEYGYLRPILRLIQKHGDLQYALVVTNMHLLPEFGSSIREIHDDGFEVSDEVYMAVDGYTGVTMVKSLGVFVLSFAETLQRLRPDIVLLAGDRGEQLMAGMAAAHLRIPAAHIQAGEVSGNIDGLSRHAIARFAHLHFAANVDAAERLRRSGEEEFRIHLVGASQLDDLIQGPSASAEEVAKHFRLDMARPVVVLVQHPVTEQEAEADEQMTVTLSALEDIGCQTVLLYPNNDAGSYQIREAIHRRRAPSLRVERNVSRYLYAGLMRIAAVMVGNSSSALIEAPVFRLPVVNIGRRQADRVQGANVINVEHDRAAIKAAIARAMSGEFRARLADMESPYGDGHASERIVEILAKIPIDERLLYKHLTF